MNQFAKSPSSGTSVVFAAEHLIAIGLHPVLDSAVGDDMPQRTRVTLIPILKGLKPLAGGKLAPPPE